MKAEHLPRLSARFWILITAASVFGADLGDFCSHVLGLGHWRGVPFLAVIFVIIILAERVSSLRTELFYWLAVVTLRTAATNLADLATHDLKVDDPAFLATLGIPLLALALLQDRRGAWFVDGGKPSAGWLYWLAMLLASTFGTALGDYNADLFGLANSTAIWFVLWAIGAALAVRAGLIPAVAYWAMVCVVRTFGTNLGDLVAGRHGLALGLPVSTSLSALVFFGLYFAWPRPAPSLTPSIAE